MEAAIGCLAQTIIDALSTDRLRTWIRRVGLADEIKMLESKVQIVDVVYAAVRERAAGNKPLGRSLALLKDVLYDADDLVDELDYYSLLESSPTTGSSVRRKDTPTQSGQADYGLDSPTTDSSDNAMGEHDDISGAVQSLEKSWQDMDIHSRRKKRPPVWDHFVIATYQNARPVKARCVHCGMELMPASEKHGTSHLLIHLSECGKKAAAKFSDGADNAWRGQEETYGAVQVDKKSRGDTDIGSGQAGKTRSVVWEHFVVSEADENNRPVKAKCVRCGSELNCGPKHGTSGLKRHINSPGCTKKAADQPLNPSSSADGTENGETVASGDPRSTKRKRMDYESTHTTKAKTHLWNKAESSHRIQDITRLLDDISKVLSEVLKLHGADFVASSNHYRSTTSDQHRRTSSLVPRKIYGRVAEKDRIIKFMTEDTPDGLCVLPIVGSGGVGKTALAQLVYNDPTVVEHFDQRIWVSVSNSFDEVRLSREILDCLVQQTHEGLCSFSKLQEILKMHITSKRILLILDDVWDDFNSCRWNQLLAPFHSNTKGTVILMTTRKFSVAQAVGTAAPIELSGLACDDFWLLFKSCAFGDEDYGMNHQILSIIGLEIAKKLKGNPLAAVTVGGLLIRNLTIDHWSNTLKNEDWKSLQLNGGIMSALKLSYDQLPYHLQQCFSLCSIFPEKYQFLGEELVQIWISQGFVKCDHSNQRLEEKAMDYLADLVNSGFFQKVETEEIYPGSRTCYVICDLMYDFAREVSRTECATIDGLQCCETPPTIRHLSIVSDSGYSTDQHGNIPRNKKFERKMLTICTSLRKLRTLVLIGQYDSFFFKSFEGILQEAHNLRVLHISAASAGFSPLLCSLLNPTHLRYLKVDAANRLGALPRILSKFRHLQVLHVCSYTTIPDSIDHIVSLRHLVAEEGTYSSIANIGNLTSLQELPKFVVQNSSGFEMTQLQSMKELVQLGVSQLENVKTREEAYGAGLRDKQHLEELHLSWKGASSDDEYDSHMSSYNDWLSVDVLEGLEPHNNLKHLRISGYNGHLSPTWLTSSISVTSLQTLHIEGCGKLEILPSLEQLPFLRKLKLMEMRSVTEVSIPSLEELVLIQMPKFERCSCISTRDLSSSLRVLKIERCPAMKIFPLFESSQKFEIKQKSWLPSLRELIIHGCPNLLVPHPLPSSTTICKLSIVDVPTLPRIEGSSGDTLTIGSRSEGYDNFDHSSDVMTILDCKILAFHNLRGLRYLHLDGCQNLVSISFPGLVQLVSLQSLEISSCRKLFSSNVIPEHTHEDVTAANDNSLPSLVTLRIKCCGITGKWLSLMLGYVQDLAELFLEDCPGITQLVLEEEENIRSYGISVPVDSSSRGPDDRLLRNSAQDGLLCLPLNLMSSLKNISFRECPHLVFRGNNNKDLSRFTCLEKLTIWGCPGLLSSLVDTDGNDDQTNGRWLLPKSLEELEIRGDSPDMLQPCFPGNLTCLRKVQVWFSPSLRSLQLCNCTALEELIIGNCGLLAALESLRFLGSLRYFKVFRSPGVLPCLENLSRQGYDLFLGLERLVIDGPSVFTMSFCKQLTSLQHLELENWEFVTRLTEEQERGLQLLTSLQELEFRGCSYDLKYLPAALHCLPSLKRLKINDCLGISRLPEQGLPLSLQELDISNCSKVFNDHCKSLATGKLKVKIVGNTLV